MPAHRSPIVVGWDDSEGARQAARWAAAVAGALRGTPLHLVTALTLPPVPSHSWEMSVAELLGRHETAARARLEDEKRELVSVAPAIEIFLRRFTPVETLLEHADKHDAAAIVLGRNPHLAPHLLLGSTSSAVARLASRPVVVVRGAEHAAPPRRLLLAIDGSAPSRRAAAAVAHLFPGSEVTVVAVHDGRTDLDAAALAELAGAAGFAADRIAARVESGHAVERLLELVGDGFDLVAIGRTGHSAWRALLLGGVAEKLLRLAPCPVLLAH
jgi:nucleotide-binding universal stress UspA family protein